jgi:hypothetical protein
MSSTAGLCCRPQVLDSTFILSESSPVFVTLADNLPSSSTQLSTSLERPELDHTPSPTPIHSHTSPIRQTHSSNLSESVHPLPSSNRRNNHTPPSSPISNQSSPSGLDSPYFTPPEQPSPIVFAPPPFEQQVIERLQYLEQELDFARWHIGRLYGLIDGANHYRPLRPQLAPNPFLPIHQEVEVQTNISALPSEDIDVHVPPPPIARTSTPPPRVSSREVVHNIEIHHHRIHPLFGTEIGLPQIYRTRTARIYRNRETYQIHQIHFEEVDQSRRPHQENA